MKMNGSHLEQFRYIFFIIISKGPNNYDVIVLINVRFNLSKLDICDHKNGATE